MLILNKVKKIKFYSIIGAFILISASIVTTVMPDHVVAASYTWDGGGTDGTCGGNVGDGNKWSCALNWSSDIVPVAGDTVTFNGTSTKDAVVDAAFGGTTSTFTISSGYTGTITLQRSITITGAYAQSDGHFNASNQTFDLNSTFTMNAGSTFTASSGNTFFGQAFTVNGGTFNHNGGLVTFDGSGIAGLTCNGITFNLVTFAQTGNPRIVGTTCTMPLGNNPILTNTSVLSVSGTLTGSGIFHTDGSLTVNSTGVLDTFTGFRIGQGTPLGGAFRTSAVFDASSYSPFEVGSGFILDSGANFTAPALLEVGATLTINSGSTFNHNNGSIIITNNNNTFTPDSTLSCNNTTFNSVTFAHTTGTRTISSNCNFPVGTNPTFSTGHISLSGTLTGTGTLTMGGALTLNTGSSITSITGVSSAGFTSSITTVFTTFSSSGVFALNSGANFTAPSGTMSVGSTFTINSGSTFTHHSGTVNFDGTAAATLSCNNTTFNLVTFDYTGLSTSNPGTKTVSANCSFPLGNNPTVEHPITLTGTITGTGTLTLDNTFLHNIGGIISEFDEVIYNDDHSYIGGTYTNINKLTFNAPILFTDFDASAFDEIEVNTDFTLNTGVDFTAPTLLKVSGWWTNEGTFTHNNSTVELTGTDPIAIDGDTTFYNLTYTPGASNTISFKDGNVQTIINSLILKGQDGQLITLESFDPGNIWEIDVQGTSDVEYVRVSDSNSIGNIITVGCDSIDDGNNTGWEFGSNCTSEPEPEPEPSPSAPVEIEIISIGNVQTNINSSNPTFYFVGQYLTIKGVTSPNSTIYFTYGTTTKTVISDSDGNFSIRLYLPWGKSILTYYVIDQDGNQSSIFGLTLFIGCEFFTEKLKAFYCTRQVTYPPISLPTSEPEPKLPETGEPEIDIDTIGDIETPIKLWQLMLCFVPIFIILPIMFFTASKGKKKYSKNTSKL